MDRFPDTVRIETAGRCNFTCRHCPIENLRGLISFDSFQRVFNSLPHVPKMLILNHGGEPMLNKDLEKIVSYAKGKQVRTIVLNTNASLIRPIPGLTEMYVSFDGTTIEENNYIRTGSNFEKHAARVKEVAKKQKVTIYNVQASGGFKPMIAKYLTDYFGSSVSYETDPMRLWSGHESYNDKPLVHLPKSPVECKSMMNGFHVMSDGDVVQCCEDLNGQNIHGNVFTNSPLEIWNQMQSIRDDFRSHNYSEMCKKCWVVGGIYYDI